MLLRWANRGSGQSHLQMNARDHYELRRDHAASK